MRHVVEKNSPLSQPVFLILTSLAHEPRHGYALIQDIETLSGGQVRLGTGTLYGALGRLLKARWIERFETDDTSRDKQTYRLTPLGRDHLAEDLDRLKALTRVAAARLRAKEA
jgi:DNA-binding PadR family transcriptional regulator